MATSNHPLAPDPETNIDTPFPVPEPRREDLGKPVPLGEPEDEGYVIEEEDREYPPPGGK
jgi:hypothetical protein